MSGHVLRPSVNFDAGNNARIGEGFGERRAVEFLLADCFVVENRAADALAETGRCDDQFPIRAPGFHRLRNAQLRKSFVASGIAFIHRQQTHVVGNQLACGIY
jgi:hypothetical protein